jgi:hypothetical protein
MTPVSTPRITMPTNLNGRLRNTPLPLTGGLLPVHEAVVNSIHAIEENGLAANDGKIKIVVLREDRQGTLDITDISRRPGPERLDEIVGFKIIDNGIGFNDDNMLSFRTLDTEHKANIGCRGIGRLLWLKAFSSVSVDSVYQCNGSFLKREFSFTAEDGVAECETTSRGAVSSAKTIIQLNGFHAQYRKYSRKTCRSIAESIFQHCLWYYIREGGAPLIEIVDDSERVSLNDVFNDFVSSEAITEQITIKGNSFDLIHVRLRSNSNSNHSIAYCADNRLVKEEKLAGKIPGLYGWLADDIGDFVYYCYVGSHFLNQTVRPERTEFEIIDHLDGTIDLELITWADIRSEIVGRVQAQLSPYLEENIGRAKCKVETFVSEKAPRYRPVLARILENELNVDPNISDKELELLLHKQLAVIESELISEGHDVLGQTLGPLDDEYQNRLQVYLEKAEDIKKSDLASYVSHRRTIIDLLEKAIEKDVAGNYVREDLIHGLIMPMRKDSDDVSPNVCNLWLVDERLAFHNYLASDKPLKSLAITGDTSGKKPDICALRVFDQPILISEGTRLPLGAIEIIEIKRPMRRDAGPGEDHDPIEQAVGYLRRIRNGGVQTATGRPIPGSDLIPGFCYILADLTPQFEERCKDHHDLKRTFDGLGYFGYKSNANAYIEVVSFDRLVASVKERNRAFFDQLGLPAN